MTELGPMPQQITAAVRLPDEAQLPAPRNELELIQRLALDPRVDPDKLQRLLEMRFAVEQRDAELQYREAMSRLQPRLPIINKRGKIILMRDGQFKGETRFARWDDIHRGCMPLLCEEGFSVSFNTEDVPPNKTRILITVSHRAGHSETSSVTLPAIDESPGKGNVQKAGSVFSYGRRYAFCDAFNILTEEQDDDGTGGVPKPITLEQKNQILNLLQAALEREPGVELRMNAWLGNQRIAKIEDITQGPLFEQVVQILRKKIK